VAAASRPSGRLLAGAATALALLLGLRSAFPMDSGLDYFADASFAIDALVRGNLAEFAANPALMGNFSLLLRAPFVATVFEHDLAVVYFAGALPCVLAVVALGLALRHRMRALGKPAAAATLVAALAVLNPGVFRSLHWGHPEELLAGALCVGAILAGTRERSLLAGVLLGLALATKQWALIAVIPTLLAASGQRVRLLVAAGALALVLTLPSLVGGSGQFVSMQKSAVAAEAVVTAPNVWWPISTPRTAAEREAASPGFGARIPTWLGALTHPLIVLVGIPLGWLFWRRRHALAPVDALGLFALAMLLRCLLDPWNIDYYHAPFLLALLAWEALARDGWPRLTLLAGALLALTFPSHLTSQSEITADALRYCVTYLAWALPLAGWLGLALFAPSRSPRLPALWRSESSAWATWACRSPSPSQRRVTTSSPSTSIPARSTR
jgi:hypothetical protein